MASAHLVFLDTPLSVTEAARVGPMCMLDSGASELDPDIMALPPLPSLQSSSVLLPKLLIPVMHPLVRAWVIPMALLPESVPRLLGEAVRFRVLVTAQKPLARLARLTMCRVFGLEVVTCSRALARLTLLLPQLFLVLAEVLRVALQEMITPPLLVDPSMADSVQVGRVPRTREARVRLVAMTISAPARLMPPTVQVTVRLKLLALLTRL